MSNDLADLFGEGIMSSKKTKQKKNDKCIISMLFKAQTDAKITHLLQRNKTFARHEAMSIFYDSIGDLLDTFVETSMGKDYMTDICVEECCCIEEPISYFNELYVNIESMRDKYKESFLQNQIDEIQQLIAHTLYRLKNITT